jgi:hypothetical protein
VSDVQHNHGEKDREVDVGDDMADELDYGSSPNARIQRQREVEPCRGTEQHKYGKGKRFAVKWQRDIFSDWISLPTRMTSLPSPSRSPSSSAEAAILPMDRTA